MSNNGSLLPGQGAGFLGSACEPFLTGDPSLPGYKVPGLDLPRELPLERIGRRRALLEAVDRALDGSEAVERLDAHYRKAFALIASPEACRAFDLSQEPQHVRARYGLDPGTDRSREARHFGGLPHLGQCLLLTRRLIEAGVHLVTVCTGARYDQSWDTHRDHFPLLKRSILPMSIEASRPCWTTCMRVACSTRRWSSRWASSAGPPGSARSPAAPAPTRGSRPLAALLHRAVRRGGMPAGAVYGASDAEAAHPARDPVTPEDMAATYAFTGRTSIAVGEFWVDPSNRV